MKIFTGEIPENPCKKCNHKEIDDYGCVNVLPCIDLPFYAGQQYILDQCIDFDFQKFKDWVSNKLDKEKNCLELDEFIYLFLNFIKEQVEK